MLWRVREVLSLNNLGAIISFIIIISFLPISIYALLSVPLAIYFCLNLPAPFNIISLCFISFPSLFLLILNVFLPLYLYISANNQNE